MDTDEIINNYRLFDKLKHSLRVDVSDLNMVNDGVDIEVVAESLFNTVVDWLNQSTESILFIKK